MLLLGTLEWTNVNVSLVPDIANNTLLVFPLQGVVLGTGLWHVDCIPAIEYLPAGTFERSI